jgi:hypothetical protein
MRPPALWLRLRFHSRVPPAPRPEPLHDSFERRLLIDGHREEVMTRLCDSPNSFQVVDPPIESPTELMRRHLAKCGHYGPRPPIWRSSKETNGM